MTQGQDLLTGSVPKKLIRFAFPLFLANLLQALYNVVDMLVVGKIVGKTGLAAISNASMLCFIINSLCIGLTMGGSVLVAQCKGANDQTGQRDTIGMLFFLSLVGSAVVTILGLAIYEALFQALNVPANAYQDACGYMKIICCGTVFVFGYNAVCSILKGLGDSQTPLFFVGVATVLNVVLDVLLVGPLSMGTAGAAWATITAQGVSFMGSLVYLRRYQPGFSLRKIEFHREKLLAILKVGLPTAIQMVVVNTAYLLVTGMLNQFGTPVAAASGVGLKINTFAGMHCWAIGQAITAMVGQCLGAGQIERARKVVRSGLLLNLSVTAAVADLIQSCLDFLPLAAPGVQRGDQFLCHRRPVRKPAHSFQRQVSGKPLPVLHIGLCLAVDSGEQVPGRILAVHRIAVPGDAIFRPDAEGAFHLLDLMAGHELLQSGRHPVGQVFDSGEFFSQS